MQIRNIRPFSQHEPGDVVEVPDGAAFDPFHWEPIEEAGHGAAGTQAGVEADAQAASAPASATPAAADVPRLPYPAKEM